MGSLICGIHHVALKCDGTAEFEKTLHFYQNVLGLEPVRSWGEGENAGAMLSTGDGLLEIFASGKKLPQGAIRIRKNGSAGTHNGMRSIVGLLGYENFPRLRVGVGQRRPGYELADWVLGHYLPGEEQQTADAAYALAADAIIEYITNGIESAMCKYNTKKTKKPPEPAEGADA